jgi:predicted dehydrogenase
VAQRAQREANLWGCTAAAPTELLERDDVDAVLVLDPGWYRLWPVDAATRLGKPVFCAASLAADEAHADALHQQVQERRVPVVMEMLPRFAAVTARLRELLQTTLGPPRWVTCSLGSGYDPARSARSRGETSTSPVLEPLGPAGIGLLDWCLGLLGAEPRSVVAAGVGRAALGSIFLELDGERAVQISRHRSPGGARSLRLTVGAERGTAWVDWPGRIGWTEQGSHHTQTFPRTQPVGQVLLEHFARVREGAAPAEPGLPEAYRALRWLRAAAQSRAEGRRVDLPA